MQFNFFNISISDEQLQKILMFKEKQEEQQSQISYLYSQNNPATLVILSNFQTIIRKMFKRIFNRIFWIHNYPTIQEVTFIESELQLNIECFQDIQQTIKYWQEIDKKEENGRFIIICPSRFRNNLASLARSRSIVKIIFFEKVKKNIALQSHIDWDQQNSSIYSEADEANIQSFDDIVSYIYSKDQLLKELKQWRKEVLESQLMPSFISLTRNSWSSNALSRSIVAMIKQPIDQQTRSKIAQKLLKILLLIAESCFEYSTYIKAIKSFGKEIKQNQLSTERAIFWYTVQSPIYKFVNNMLRFTTSPTQIFYIQPFFKDLYQAVKKMYTEQKNQNNYEKMFCYRGGNITIQEAKMLQDSTGAIVQNLGFLSTSKVQNVASTYVKNTMFSIIVEQKSACQADIGGYTEIKFQSCYYSEEEVLFNPLNNFKVVQFSLKTYEKGVQKYWICMEQCNREVQFEKKNDGIQDDDKNVQYLLRYQQRVEKMIICQGDALCFSQQVLQNSKQYWQKYLQISRSSEDRMRGLLKNASVFFSMHENDRVFEVLKQVIRKSEDQWHRQRKTFQNNKNSMQIYFQALIRAGNLCYNQLKLKSALSFYQIAKKVQSIMLPRKICCEIGVRCCIANIYSLLGKQHVALQDYLQCLELAKSNNVNQLDYSNILNNIGYMYQIFDQNTQALIYLKQSLRVKTAIIGKFHHFYISTMVNISVSYFKQSYFSKAKQIYHECLHLFTTNDYLVTTSQKMASICSGIAQCQKYQGNTQQALCYYAKARQHLRSFKNSKMIQVYTQALKDQGFVYFLQEEYQKSWYKLKLAQKIGKKLEKTEKAISEIEIMKTFILIRLEILKKIQKQNRRLKRLQYYYEDMGRQTRKKYYYKFKLKIQKMKKRNKTTKLFLEFQSI